MIRYRYFVALIVALAIFLAPLAVAAQGVASSGPHFANATYTGPPSCRDVLLPDLNVDTALHLCSIVRRPAEGGGMRIVSLFTSDGELGIVDMAAYGYFDCFGADAWPSRFTGTLKAVVNCKAGDGNDRRMVYIDTGIAALPEGIRSPRRRRARRYGATDDYPGAPSMVDRFKAVIVGVGHDPAVVARARAVALYGIPIGVSLLIGWLNHITNPAYYGLVAVLSPLIRAVGEALIDQINKPGQNDPIV